METQLLRDHEVIPTDNVLEDRLGAIFPTFEILRKAVTGNDFGLTLEWNYYRDGKAWLCKTSNKKKTVFWLSIWEGYFQIAFFFTAKHLDGIASLEVNKKIKEDFLKEKAVGKLLPMVFRIKSETQLPDLFKVIEFKKKQK